MGSAFRKMTVGRIKKYGDFAYKPSQTIVLWMKINPDEEVISINHMFDGTVVGNLIEIEPNYFREYMVAYSFNYEEVLDKVKDLPDNKELYLWELA